MIKLAYYEKYLNVVGYSDFHIFEFDVLTHFPKICMIIHVYEMDFSCSTIFYKRMGIHVTNWVTPF